MKLLFITRKYPPSVGGMEKVSYELSRELAKQVPTTVIAWGGSQKWLPYFLPKAFFQAIYYINDITNVHLGDGLLAPLGLILKLLTRRKVSVTVHGLDVTWPNPAYQIMIPFCLKRLDKIICISQATLQECTRRGIPPEKCTVIGWGVNPDEFKINATRKDLEHLIKRSLTDKKVLITVGRLVPRKGVHWFVSEVMPQLDARYVYLVVGEGSDRSKIEAAINHYNLRDRVYLLGKISDHDRKIVYSTADVFVMPNIPVKGNVEGFGIVALEAAAAGLPVVASDVEGVRDALANRRTSYLYSPKDSGAVLAVLKKVPDSIKNRNSSEVEDYLWPAVAKKYSAVFS